MNKLIHSLPNAFILLFSISVASAASSLNLNHTLNQAPVSRDAAQVSCNNKDSSTPAELKAIVPDPYCCTSVIASECLESKIESLTGVRDLIKTHYDALNGAVPGVAAAPSLDRDVSLPPNASVDQLRGEIYSLIQDIQRGNGLIKANISALKSKCIEYTQETEVHTTYTP
ncbi:MAG: hypothetical protein K8R69_10680 [Deltaproteobacteria bacterium]|nr:hypothetical protein [Deltaproteobacteria bacterium]